MTTLLVPVLAGISVFCLGLALELHRDECAVRQARARRDRLTIHRRLGIALLAIVLLLPGCVWLKAAGRTARDGMITGGAAVVGWAIGAAGGPVVQGLLIFFGAAGGKAVSDSVALSSGEIQGEGAAIKEAERLRITLASMGAHVEGLEGALTGARKAAEIASGAARWYRSWWLRSILIAGAYVAFLKREWWWAWIRGKVQELTDDGIERERRVSRAFAFKHAVWGGRKSKEQALGKRRKGGR